MGTLTVTAGEWDLRAPVPLPDDYPQAHVQWGFPDPIKEEKVGHVCEADGTMYGRKLPYELRYCLPSGTLTVFYEDGSDVLVFNYLISDKVVAKACQAHEHTLEFLEHADAVRQYCDLAEKEGDDHPDCVLLEEELFNIEDAAVNSALAVIRS